MEDETIQKLLELNRRFYQTFAVHFSETRGRLQPGVRRVLYDLTMDSNILDLGCGNGNFAQALAQRDFSGTYLGLDTSTELLSIAQESLDDHKKFSFFHCDLADKDWDFRVRHFAKAHKQNLEFDVVVSFATLHHLPGQNLHMQTFEKVHKLLKNNGQFIISNWQFLHSERLCNRILDWETLGLTDSDVDSGDYLLDWRQGGRGLRYAHHFSIDEMMALAERTAFVVVNSFLSDGENNNLGLYLVLEKS